MSNKNPNYQEKVKLSKFISIKMRKWGKSRYVNDDGTLTEQGKKRYFEKRLSK